MATKSTPTDKEEQLIEELQTFKYDPYGFVLYAYPWGEKYTPLANVDGPRAWQVDEFKRISDHLMADAELSRMGFPPRVYYSATSSGRGPGKSALLGMLADWMKSCWIGSTTIVTANTETQLRSRTMAELGKWTTMSINSHWFERSMLKVTVAQWFRSLVETQLGIDTQYYYVEGQSWSEENPDAFAGAHNSNGMMVAFDEASGIPDPIWTVTEGFFTDVTMARLWLVISNPRRNTGKFYECFHDPLDQWNTRCIDSRTVEGVDTQVYDRIVAKNGEDSDVARVEVRGMFPKKGDTQLISRYTVEMASTRVVEENPYAPLIMALDPSRQGKDSNVVRWRQGRDARTIPPVRWQSNDLMVTADKTAKLIDDTQPDAVIIDGGGLGGGVIDRLRQLGYEVLEVNGAESPNNAKKYGNKRAEMWGDMGEWALTGAIDDCPLLARDLTTMEYYEHETTFKVYLESKKDRRSRGLPSPDDGDALGLTFGRKVKVRGSRRRRGRNGVVLATGMDYDIFE